MKFTTILMDADDTIFDFPKCEYNALKNTIEKNNLVFTDEVHENFSEINNSLWKSLKSKKLQEVNLKYSVSKI